LKNEQELERLVNLGRNIKQYSGLGDLEKDSVIAELFDFECFSQAFSLLKHQLLNSPQDSARSLKTLQKMAYAKLVGLEHEDDFLDVLRFALQKLEPSFETLRFHLVEHVSGAENFFLHVRVYKELSPFFKDTQLKVQCLERLALILEKKLFLEKEVEPVYREIIEIDKYNIKACRFYRVYYSHLLNWPEVAEMLERLLKIFPYKNEKQRTAHELAQVYLYQLGNPEKAEQILKEYCEDSFLDARQTWLDCYEKQSRFDDLANFLEKCSNDEKNLVLSSQLLHRKALVLLRNDKEEEAQKTLLASIEKDPTNLVAYESLAIFLAERKSIDKLLGLLKQLESQLRVENSRNSLQGIINRIEKIAIM
jgi:tetratricopeptide (TPR) repeat protein